MNETSETVIPAIIAAVLFAIAFAVYLDAARVDPSSSDARGRYDRRFGERESGRPRQN
ncbi:MAG: hypothetical protein IPK60_13605 [Sandaracinaceae bacterium]|nr:hypothetical protein [Sandaracinaceae bacterium]